MYLTQGLRATLRTGSQLLTGLLLLLLTVVWEQAQAQQPGFLTDGLVAYYPFNGDANDESGKGHNPSQVAVSGSAPNRFGQIGKALKFNGTSDMVTYAPFLSGSQLTISAWILQNDIPGPLSDKGNPVGILSQGAVIGDFYPDVAFLLIAKNGTCYPALESGYQSTYISWSDVAKLDTNKWIQVVQTFSNGKVQQYVGGVLVASGSVAYASFPNSGRPLLIGSRVSATGHGMQFNGFLDDIRIYNRVFSEAEVKALYDYESKPPDNSFITNGLVAYYPFNGNANDESGNGNHGANLGGVSDVDRNGKVGGAYRFVDGQYVNVPHSDSLNFGDKKPMTVAFWVKRQSGEAHLLGKRAGQNDCSFQVHSGAFHGSAGNWRAGLAFDVPADPNQWSYITYTFDGDRMAAFINGQLQTSQTGRVLGPLSTAPIKIGSFWGMFLKGSLDEVRFYNRGLSDAEVAALYAYESGTGLPQITKSPRGGAVFPRAKSQS